MMVYTILIQLENDSNKLKQLVSMGVIPLKVFMQFEMYKDYLAELEKNRNQKNCVLQSVSNTAEKHKVVERTVFRAIQFNQSTIIKAS